MARHGEYQHGNIGRSGRSHHCTHVWYVAKTVHLWYHLTILRFIIWWNNTFAHRHVDVAVRIVCVSENWCCCHFLASWSRNKGDTGGEVLLVHVSCHFCTPRASSGWLFWLGDSWWFFFFPSVLSSLLYFVVVFYKGFTLIWVRFLVLASLSWERAIYGRERGQM